LPGRWRGFYRRSDRDRFKGSWGECQGLVDKVDFEFNDWEETRDWGLIEPPGLLGAGGDLLQRSTTRTKRKKRRKKPRRTLGTLCFILFFIGLLLLGYFLAGGYLPRFGKEGFTPPAVAAERVMPVLLLGVDRREPQEPSRADTIIVAFLDRKEKKVRLLSIPRDTYTFVPGRSHKDKINLSHALGGPEATAEAVSDLLGIDVKYYVETDFEGFEEIIDTLGGVTIEVQQRMYYPAEGINLYPGVQRLNGYDALAFVRFRGYPLGDIDRIKQQQRFFSALADEALHWRNLWRIPDLVRALKDAVKTNLGVSEMIELAKLFRNIDSSQVEGYILPGDSETINGGSYLVPRLEEIPPLVRALHEGSSPERRLPEENSSPEDAAAAPVTAEP